MQTARRQLLSSEANALRFQENASSRIRRSKRFKPLFQPSVKSPSISPSVRALRPTSTVGSVPDAVAAQNVANQRDGKALAARIGPASMWIIRGRPVLREATSPASSSLRMCLSKDGIAKSCGACRSDTDAGPSSRGSITAPRVGLSLRKGLNQVG